MNSQNGRSDTATKKTAKQIRSEEIILNSPHRNIET